MIEFATITFTYPAASAPVLRRVNLTVPEGELCLVVGRTGSGKSTLLQSVNGLVPHFTGGDLHGHVRVAGRDTRDFPPRELADVVGFVGQDPLAGFVTDHVEDELAYVMESLALPEPVMRKRVEETLDLLGLAELRDRPLATLSGGQQQRVAIGAALTAHPRILVLDEPTSALDPGAAEEVLAVLHRLVHDLGMTVLLAEHRLERVAQYADRVVWLPAGAQPIVAGEPGFVLAQTPVAPPIVRLGGMVGWQPPPVSIREARRLAQQLRLAPLARREVAPLTDNKSKPLVQVDKLDVHYGEVSALQSVNFNVHPGERMAIMGRNGAGKSSLLWAIQGTGDRAGGTATVTGTDPASVPADRRRQLAGLVPQNPADLLYLETVAHECAQADHESGMPAGSCQALLTEILPGVPPSAHPRDLSEGQRLALVLAIMLTAAPALILLDEPTRGLDYPAKEALAAFLSRQSEAGHAVMVTTHDVEFVAEFATRVMVLADGEIVADGPAADILTSSPLYAPQLAKVFAPHHVLTLRDFQGTFGKSDR